MSAIKINESLWNALSDEERDTVLSYFNTGNPDQEDFNVVPDPDMPVPRADCLIYSITENELYDLTDDELKCRIKNHLDAAKELDYCINQYSNAALLVCFIFIIEKYKKNVSCLRELSDQESAICDSIVSKLKESVAQSEKAKNWPYKVTIGDIATRELFYGKKRLPPFAHPPVPGERIILERPVHAEMSVEYSMRHSMRRMCWYLGYCLKGNYYYECDCD